MYKRQGRERCFKSERYCERKREIEIFKISRDYEEFMERLGGEMIYNKCSKSVSYTHLDVYKRQVPHSTSKGQQRCIAVDLVLIRSFSQITIHHQDVTVEF